MKLPLPYLLLSLAMLVATRVFAQSNAPTGLTGTAPAYNRVVLTWKDNSTNETRFEIERNNFTSFTKIGEVGANVTTYTDNSVGGGTYRVRVIFPTGATAVSNEFTISTPPEPPGTPTGLTVIPQNSNSIKLTWNNGSGSAPTDYRIERGTSSGGTFTLLQTVTYSRAPTFTDGSVSGGQPYCYRVRSQSGSVVSEFTAPICATPPLSPTNVKNLQANALSSSSIKLTWDRYGKESGIGIERRTGQSGDWRQVATTLADGGEFTDNNLSSNTEYCYRISESGHDYSSTACATTRQSAPRAPARLTATAVSSSQLNLTWADLSDNEANFELQRADSPGAQFSTIQTLGPNTVTFSDQGLRASNQYCYRIRAVNSIGASDYTDSQCATTQAPPVGAPQNLVATATSTTQINLIWAGVSGATSYQLERSPNGNDGWNKVADPAGNAVSYDDPGLTPNTRYYYRVRAVVNGTPGPFSNVANAITPDVPPAAPARLDATAVSYNQINLSWADLSGNESGFQLERSPNGTDGWSKLADLGPNATSYEDKSVQPQTHYFYRVRAINAAGPSANSNVADATTPVGPPTAAQDLKATATSTTQISLTWSAIPNAATILIERSPDGTTGWTSLTTVGGTATSYTDNNLTVNTHYYYRIRATNASGQGPTSNVADATTPDVPPAPPARLTATAVSPTQINLAWADLSGNESGFELERGASATGTFEKIADLPANTTSYEDKNLTDNRPYCYRIRAKNAAGPSAYSDAACATTPLAPPAVPTNLTAQVSDYDQIRLNWSALSPSAVTVVIERSTNPTSGFAEIKQQPASQTSYLDMGLQEFTTYYYRIRAVNMAGNSGYSNVASARIEEVIIAVEDELATHTTLYMNQQDLHVVTNWFSSMRATIQLMTATGQPVLTDTRKVNPADAWHYALDRLPTGIYIISIVADGRSLTKRILIP
ncbi:hypothetical protein GCM10028818_31750 [Spirosoma horti]